MFMLEGHKIEFDHDPIVHGAITGEHSGKLLPYQGVTVCLFDGEAVGIAMCSVKDHFDKNTGRKVALKKALDGLGFTREVRAEVWNEYFSARGGKTW